MTLFPDDGGGELKQLFFESAQELLQALNEQALRLEQEPGNAEIVRSVRRTVHTLKGDSAACGYQELSSLAHRLEDVLTPEIAARGTGSVAEVVLSAADTFNEMLSAYRSNLQPRSTKVLQSRIEALLQAPSQALGTANATSFAWSEYDKVIINNAAKAGAKIYFVSLGIDPQCPMRTAAVQLVHNVLSEAGEVLVMHPEDDRPDIVRIEAAVSSRLKQTTLEKKCRIPSVVADVAVLKYDATRQGDDDVLGILPSEGSSPGSRRTSLEEELLAELNVPTPAEVQAAPQQSPAVNSVSSENLLRIDAERIDTVLNLVGELIIAKSMLHQAVQEFDKRFAHDPLRGKFSDAMTFQARVLNDLQKSVMKIRMVPVEQLFRRLPRVMRDAAKSSGKEVDLVISGEDTDLDKSILDALAEPLTHLVRNAVDHGIESAAERAAAAKPERGTVRLKAYHQGNQIVIEVSDDGRGIDRNRVVAKAIERGVIAPQQAACLADPEALNLIFHPGLSTAEQVTAISGRGIGMDVVKSVLESLKGSISIGTDVGVGTTFLLKVPLTLAIIKALLFRVADRIYAVPLGSVVEITRATESDIHRVEQHEVMRLRNQVLTLVRLRKLARSDAGTNAKLFIVVIALAERRFGLIVERLVGEEELVIKAVDDTLVATELVSGASILGDGTVVLILNIPAVVERLGKFQAVGAMA